MTILWGIILLGIGLLFTLKSEFFLRTIGRVMAAEEHFRVFGGSRLFYKIVGFLFIFVGFLFITGLADNFFLWLFGPLLRTIYQVP